MKSTTFLLRFLSGLLATCFTVNDAFAQGRGHGGGGGGSGSTGPAYQIFRLETSDAAGGYLNGQARDINSNASPLVVGHVNFADDSFKATAWAVTTTNNGIDSQLSFLDDTGFEFANSFAKGCNENGGIVGAVSDPQDIFINPAYWSSSQGALEILPSSGLGEASAVNDQEVVCGYSAARALVWSRVAGQWQALELTPLGDSGTDPEGNPLPDIFFANDITNVDADSHSVIVVGRSNGKAAAWQVFVDQQTNVLTAGSAMILPSIGEGWAEAVNSSGTIAGWAQIGFSSGGDGVVWIDGQVQLLALTEPPKPYNTAPRQSWPNNISDTGMLVGDDSFRAVIWVDENASTIVLDGFLSKGKNAQFTSLTTAFAVNRANEVVGYGWYEPDQKLIPFLAVPSSN